MVVAVSGTALVWTTAPATAAANDDFSAETTDGCGVVNFIDYGPGEAGGGDNDDYLVIHDYCADGHGVMAYTAVENVSLGSKYNGNGLAGAAVIWDPYKARGNVVAGEHVSIAVCLVDGASDPTPSSCGAAGHVSADG